MKVKIEPSILRKNTVSDSGKMSNAPLTTLSPFTLPSNLSPSRQIVSFSPEGDIAFGGNSYWPTQASRSFVSRLIATRGLGSSGAFGGSSETFLYEYALPR